MWRRHLPLRARRCPSPHPRALLRAELVLSMALHSGPALLVTCVTAAGAGPGELVGRVFLPCQWEPRTLLDEVKGEAVLGNTDAGHRLFAPGLGNIRGRLREHTLKGLTREGGELAGEDMGVGRGAGWGEPGDGAQTRPLCSVASGMPARAPRGPAGGLLGKRSRLTAHPGFVLGTPDSPRDGEMSHAGVHSRSLSQGLRFPLVPPRAASGSRPLAQPRRDARLRHFRGS